ncbi:LPP20 family lipoprotein [Desulfocurvibacter africanus]|uniref:LPP20 family lipoprotein n=1 Tax=Desulfocurvibacter africanus TaxID=873 RepID=UPI001378A1C2|nr:LPP20 family lipoprotein [Desulfocurvibacter africanus]
MSSFAHARPRARLAYGLTVCIQTALLFFVAMSCAWAASLPNWYLNPPQIDEHTLYGVGEGANFQEARRMALNAIAEEISVTITSKLDQRASMSHGSGGASYDKQVNQRLTAEIQKIRFNNAEVVRNEVTGGKVYLLMSVDRQALATDQKAELDRKLASMDELYKSGRNDPIHRKFQKLKSISAEKAGILSLVAIMRGLDGSFDPNPIHARLQVYERELLAIRNQVVVHVRPDKQMPQVKDMLEAAFADESIKVSSPPPNKNPHALVVSYSTELQNREIYSSRMSKLIVTIRTQAGGGDVVATNKIESSGSSMTDFNKSAAEAVAAFARRVREVGVMNIIGLQ